jgi:uncharacterized protein (UPF0332 family)
MFHENNDPRRIELALYRLQIAQEDFDTAQDDFNKNHLRAANNRAYYSIYHSITAVLALDQIAFKKHKDTLAYFNKEYVHSNIFPRELGHQISIAQEVRHASDYDEFYIASKEETQSQIECAKRLLALVTAYLEEYEIE